MEKLYFETKIINNLNGECIQLHFINNNRFNIKRDMEISNETS